MTPSRCCAGPTANVMGLLRCRAAVVVADALPAVAVAPTVTVPPLMTRGGQGRRSGLALPALRSNESHRRRPKRTRGRPLATRARSPYVAGERASPQSARRRSISLAIHTSAARVSDGTAADQRGSLGRWPRPSGRSCMNRWLVRYRCEKKSSAGVVD